MEGRKGMCIKSTTTTTTTNNYEEEEDDCEVWRGLRGSGVVWGSPSHRRAEPTPMNRPNDPALWRRDKER